MREQLNARLAELEAEIAIGEQRWREVDLEQARLRETLMRMSGAIQVLKELLDEPERDATGDGETLVGGAGR
jgi:predicted nuclease with TOPRIM domain